MAFNRLLAEEESLADLTVDETVRDQLEDLLLARRRLVAGLGLDGLEVDHLGDRVTARGDRLEPRGMLAVAGEDGVALGSVHCLPIG